MLSDNQLIRKIKRQQNREAANILVERYYKEIYVYAYRQTGSRELAMDLTQEIFVTILQGIGSFDGKKAAFRTWAYRIAANKITDYYRSLTHKNQSMEVAFLSQEEIGVFAGVTVDEIESQSGNLTEDVAELIIRRDTISRVMEVVAGFDMEWVQIFQKKCFEEKTFLEIAEELELSSNTVKTRFYSMIKKVRQEVVLDE